MIRKHTLQAYCNSQDQLFTFHPKATCFCLKHYKKMRFFICFICFSLGKVLLHLIEMPPISSMTFMLSLTLPLNTSSIPRIPIITRFIFDISQISFCFLTILLLITNVHIKALPMISSEMHNFSCCTVLRIHYMEVQSNEPNSCNFCNTRLLS